MHKKSNHQTKRNHNTPHRIKVLQHNVLNWSAERSNELYNTYQDIDPEIILLNTHGRKDESKIKIFRYTVYQTNMTGKLHDGVAIAVKTI